MGLTREGFGLLRVGCHMHREGSAAQFVKLAAARLALADAI